MFFMNFGYISQFTLLPSKIGIFLTSNKENTQSLHVGTL